MAYSAYMVLVRIGRDFDYDYKRYFYQIERMNYKLRSSVNIDLSHKQ